MQGLAMALQRLGRASGLLVQAGELLPGNGQGRIAAQRLPERGLGLGPGLAALLGQAEVDPGAIRRAGRDRPSMALGRLRVLPATAVDHSDQVPAIGMGRHPLQQLSQHEQRLLQPALAELGHGLRIQRRRRSRRAHGHRLPPVPEATQSSTSATPPQQHIAQGRGCRRQAKQHAHGVGQRVERVSLAGRGQAALGEL